MIFHRPQKRVKELNITVNGTNIESVQAFNFFTITSSESMCSRANHLLSINPIRSGGGGVKSPPLRIFALMH